MAHAPLHIVWFKRDLRIVDHEPLARACRAGVVLPIFCWEPTVVQTNDYAMQHQAFIQECLAELTYALKGMGLNIHIWSNGVIDALNHIHAKMPIAAIYSHEETGNLATYNIDIAVKKWCQYHRIYWHESTQNGVVRHLKNRNHWNGIWEQRMNTAIHQLPTHILGATLNPPNTPIPIAAGADKPARQKGGRSYAIGLLESFLDGRAAKFRGGISSPLTATTAGSRLSPYLAYGCLSMKEVVQATRERREWAAEVPHMFPSKLNAGLIGFESRLHWHCHFMQKLESEPEIEVNNMHHAHDNMRDEVLSDIESQKRLKAWVQGETGWPLVDACMAMLRHTGWINFRMRAMLMSTASYLYWLHWRETGLHLAREFLDYEPGIHWSQAQMQSGTTGINTLRIYSPIKQAQDQDATGAFVRHWLPALKNVPQTWIFEPYLMPKGLQLQYGCVLDKDYPAPLIGIKEATRAARSQISKARARAVDMNETQRVINKHASRKGMQGSGRDQNGHEVKQVKKATLRKANLNQQELF